MDGLVVRDLQPVGWNHPAETDFPGQSFIQISVALLRHGSQHARQEGKYHQNLLHVLGFNDCFDVHCFLLFRGMEQHPVSGLERDLDRTHPFGDILRDALRLYPHPKQSGLRHRWRC